ncbi:hypothetical protein BJY52DRAFT_32971 [Lactarius psammicola]|nr:hypothetical protein BJY52DRAFT_32971 [Lactarius psammicola]
MCRRPGPGPSPKLWPNGNTLNRSYGSLATAKFQLQLAKPSGTPFAVNYYKVLDHLEKIEAQVAFTQDRRNLSVLDRQNKIPCFRQDVFEKRVYVSIGVQQVGCHNGYFSQAKWRLLLSVCHNLMRLQ